MVDDCVAKGATVIISSQTPDNPYEKFPTIVDAPPRVSGKKIYTDWFLRHKLTHDPDVAVCWLCQRCCRCQGILVIPLDVVTL